MDALIEALGSLAISSKRLLTKSECAKHCHICGMNYISTAKACDWCGDIGLGNNIAELLNFPVIADAVAGCAQVARI